MVIAQNARASFASNDSLRGSACSSVVMGFQEEDFMRQGHLPQTLKVRLGLRSFTQCASINNNNE
jgi:hypothetical protein